MAQHEQRLDHRGWRLKLVLVVTALALAIVGRLAVSISSAAGAPPVGQTAVSLTFDDSDADQLAAEQTLHQAGLPATFYTVDGWVGQPGYLTVGNLQSIAADGNEIAGHTVFHPDLPAISAAESQRQICNDRATLASWGFAPVDFAYPFADASATTEAQVKQCGYNTARGLGDVVSPASCGGCPYAESTPPTDPYYLAAPDQVDSTWTLAQLKATVTNAHSHGGGWVILTFHHVCSNIGAANCQADQSITPTLFNQFVSWLAGYAMSATNNTTVRTIDQEVRAYLGAGYPAYQTPQAVPLPAPAPAGVNALTNPSLEAIDPNTGFPTCWQPGGWGSNTPVWTNTTAAHTGTNAQQLTVSNYSSGDAKLLPTLDLGTCSPSATPGHTYALSTWYKSTGVTQYALYYRSAPNTWNYWTSSPWFATATAWTQASWTAPPVPAGATGISFGLALIANGTLITDDYSLVDTGTSAPAGVVAAKTATVPIQAVLTHARVMAPPPDGGPARAGAHGKPRPGQQASSPIGPIKPWGGPHSQHPGVLFNVPHYMWAPQIGGNGNLHPYEPLTVPGLSYRSTGQAS